jgi:hypothetical protein
LYNLQLTRTGALLFKDGEIQVCEKWHLVPGRLHSLDKIHVGLGDWHTPNEKSLLKSKGLPENKKKKVELTIFMNFNTSRDLSLLKRLLHAPRDHTREVVKRTKDYNLLNSEKMDIQSKNCSNILLKFQHSIICKLAKSEVIK